MVIILGGDIPLKLDSIVFDIKHYLNIHSADGDLDGISLLKCEDIKELLEIRHRIKLLSDKLKHQIQDNQ